MFENQPLAEFATLQPLALLLFNHYPSSSQLLMLFVCLNGIYVLGVLSYRHRAMSFICFLFLEILNYSFGFTENTFSTFKIVLLVAVFSKSSFECVLPLNLILTVYFLAGCEKLFAFDGFQYLGNGVNLFGTSQTWEVLLVTAFQCSGLFMINRSFFQRSGWLILAILFHVMVYLRLGIGGINSPWIVSLLLCYLYERQSISLEHCKSNLQVIR